MLRVKTTHRDEEAMTTKLLKVCNAVDLAALGQLLEASNAEATVAHFVTSNAFEQQVADFEIDGPIDWVTLTD